MYDTDSKAKQGAKFLDKAKPGWWNEIDKDRLGMASSVNCMMGQLYGSDTEGEKQLGLSDRGTELGLYIPFRNILWLLTLRNPWHRLSKSWKKHISDRLVIDGIIQDSMHQSPPVHVPAAV